MATTDLQLDEPGTLPRPGPIGRLARLLFAILCLSYACKLATLAGDIMTPAGDIHPLIWNGILPGLLLISYVINIGYSRNWKKWPAIVSAILFALVAAAGYAMEGTAETVWLAGLVWCWALYIFTHLGLAFLLAATLATPGCEMRAFHDLYSRLTGNPAMEHRCPVGPLQPIDRWEAGRRRAD